jgi:hypothetical protein
MRSPFRVVSLLALITLCATLLLACGGGDSPGAPAATVRATARSAQALANSALTLRNMRAVHMGGNWGDNIDGIKSDAAIQQYLDDLKSLHAEWIGVSVAMFLDGVADPTLRLHYRPAGTTAFALYTFDDADLVRMLTMARQQGFHTYLTLSMERNGVTGASDPTCNTPAYVPPRWLLGHTSSNMTADDLTCIGASNWWWNPDHPLHAANLATFWNSYTAIATKYAAIAQQTGAEIFSLGTETEGLFRTRATAPWTDDYSAQLQAMVAAVRQVYRGWLTYDQHYDALVTRSYFTAQQTLFADLGLDIAGVSAYFPLATTARLYSESELETMWLAVFNNYVLPFQQQNPGRPVVFLEFGYTDDVGTVVQANAGEFQALAASTVTDGMQQQSNVMDAFFKVDTQLGQPVRGAFLWGTEISTPQAPHCTLQGFQVWCKPAAAVVSAAYQQLELVDADRAFNWAQVVYPSLFPSAQASFDVIGYHARYYPETATYLGYKDGHVWLHGNQWNLYDVGPLSDFLPTVAAAGY